MVTPEQTCAYFSMLAAEQKLKVYIHVDDRYMYVHVHVHVFGYSSL